MEVQKQDSEYKKLLRHILDKGHKKEDRTGVGTISTFGYQCRFDLSEGFPIVTEKKTAFKMAITELIWMIGDWTKEERYEGLKRTNIRFLLDNGCKIWTEWPYKAYCDLIDNENKSNLAQVKRWRAMGKLVKHSIIQKLSQVEFEQKIIDDKEFALKFGDLGPVYQKQWRDFEGKIQRIDQLQEMIDKLKNKPDDRRNLSSYWNPTELNEMLLPPCHMMHQVWTRELSLEEKLQWVMQHTDVEMENLAITEEAFKDTTPKRAISLQMYQRSSDCFLGVPFDWVWYAALTHMLAELTNMVVDEFIWVSGDTHLYLNSIEETKEVLASETHPYPKLNIKRKVDRIEDYRIDDFELIDYKSNKQIKVKVAV